MAAAVNADSSAPVMPITGVIAGADLFADAGVCLDASRVLPSDAGTGVGWAFCRAGLLPSDTSMNLENPSIGVLHLEVWQNALLHVGEIRHLGEYLVRGIFPGITAFGNKGKSS
jgi:hypothetical protein